MALQEDSDSICSQSPLHKRSQIKGIIRKIKSIWPNFLYSVWINLKSEGNEKSEEKGKNEGI